MPFAPPWRTRACGHACFREYSGAQGLDGPIQALNGLLAGPARPGCSTDQLGRASDSGLCGCAWAHDTEEAERLTWNRVVTRRPSTWLRCAAPRGKPTDEYGTPVKCVLQTSRFKKTENLGWRRSESFLGMAVFQAAGFRLMRMAGLTVLVVLVLHLSPEPGGLQGTVLPGHQPYSQ